MADVHSMSGRQRRAALSRANFQLGNMVVGDIIECGMTLPTTRWATAYAATARFETVIINAVNNHVRKMPCSSLEKRRLLRDPAQFAMSGVRDANVRVGDFVVVA